MRQLLLPFVTALGCAIACSPPAPTSVIVPSACKTSCGINLANALEAPIEGQWGVTIEPEFFETISEAGFDTVRIPVRWSAHTDDAAPHQIAAEFFQRIDQILSYALGEGLRVVLNLHHYDELFVAPDQHSLRALAIWAQIADRYRNLPPSVAFELCNEPNGELTPARWNDLLASLIATVRISNPTRTLIVGPGDWNNPDALTSLVLPPDDPNLLVTFHYYSPFEFTHQGASWLANSQNWLGRRWPNTAQDLIDPEQVMDRACWWAAVHGRRLWLGELGAINHADPGSRARWTHHVARTAEARNIGWAYWDFAAEFSAFDTKARAWKPLLLDALMNDRKPSASDPMEHTQ